MSARPLTLACALLALAAGCGEVPDIDLRDRAGGFDTSPDGAPLAPRPEPDARGVITYEDYQVAVARQGDTPRAIALRLGLDAGAIARTNGIDPDAGLREGELLTLPTRVPGALATQPLDVAAVATTALDRAGGASSPAATVTTAAQPIRHTVQRGETAFSIARLYNIPVGTLASWNGLDGSLTVREGQTVLIPTGAAPADPAGGPLTAPGLGSPTPVPPSATTPLPQQDTSTNLPAVSLPEAPDLTAPPPPPPTATPAPQISPPSPPVAEPDPEPEPEPAPSRSDARFLRPVAGAVIRDFNPGKNDGIDIAASAGASVQAADSGTVAAVTEDTSGVAIVVLKHADNLLTVYTNLEDLAVAKGDSVSRGGRLGVVAPGSPTFLHFEVRRGMAAVDPSDYLPG